MNDSTQTHSLDLTKLFGRRFPIDQTPAPISALGRAQDLKDNAKTQKSLHVAYMTRMRYAMPKKVVDKETPAE